jgi:rfaE bifunctional protein kinase chain/domain
LDPAQLVALIDALEGRTVAVIGDVVADEFVYGRVARVSREAPVLILEYDSTEIVAGAGGNAANNVAALGGRAALVTIVGRDGPGRRLLASMHRGVDARRVLRPAGQETTVKTRILAGGIHSAKQQVVRIDRMVARNLDAGTRSAFERAALAAMADADAVLISDYGSGLVTPQLARRLQSSRRRARHPIPVLIDTRYDLLRYHGLTACTPNESEVEQALGVHIDDDVHILERAGRDILARTENEAVVITRGSRGMALFEPDRPTVHIPIHGNDEIADVTGAGDTVMATLALALSAGASFEAAARLANYAGGLVVMKRGTATIAAAELRDAVQAVASRQAASVLPAVDAAGRRRALARRSPGGAALARRSLGGGGRVGRG